MTKFFKKINTFAISFAISFTVFNIAKADVKPLKSGQNTSRYYKDLGSSADKIEYVYDAKGHLVYQSPDLYLYSLDKKKQTKPTFTKQKTKKKQVIKPAKEIKTYLEKTDHTVFIDDVKIAEIIDTKANKNNFKKVKNAFKNKGVPEMCLPNYKPKIKGMDDENEDLNKPLARPVEVVEIQKSLKDYIEQAFEKNNISKELSKKVLKNLKHLEKTIALNTGYIKSKDHETIKKYDIPKRVAVGLEYKNKYKDVLEDIENIFKVDKDIILAVWAIETNYSSFMGDFDPFNALYSAAMNATTKARVLYFTNNLIMYTKLVDLGLFDYNTKSSFDGGLGGCQFMPDSFYNYAISYDGSKTDIINKPEDVLASIANYLQQKGWRYQEGILTEITLPENFNYCLVGLNTTKTIKEWKKLGIQENESGIGAVSMANEDKEASIIVLDIDNDDIPNNQKRAFLVYDNYRVVLTYNNRARYGIIAGILYDYFKNND